METATEEQTDSASAGPRKLLAALTLTTTSCGAWAFYHVVRGPESGALGITLLVLLTVLLIWISLSFWMATAGFVRLLRKAPTSGQALNRASRSQRPEGRTAILMPVYNESPQRVFA